jgi:hypothetical protein
MAASATNTSREIGAVTGVVILGSLMFSQLLSSLVTQMNQHHIPGPIQSFAITAVETGNFSTPPNRPTSLQKLINELTTVAFNAFHDGLRAALYLSAGLALAAGLLALITLRSHPIDAGS